MSLSIFTNASAMSSINALNKSNNLLSTAMKRLGTGKRINSAADDAAGMQIASRLQGQSNGMAVGLKNISNANALLKTAEGAFEEVSNIMYRMKDLATQGANDTNTAEDRKAINAELFELNAELKNIMTNTTFGGEKMFGVDSKFAADMNFQIGSATGETMVVDLKKELNGSGANGLFKTTSGFAGLGDWGASGVGASGAITLTNAAGAKALITSLETAMAGVTSVRSKLGASINRLEHSANNLANMKDSTDLAIGNIRDADNALEASSMSRQSMLVQTSMSMLKQSNSMSGLVMSLLG